MVDSEPYERFAFFGLRASPSSIHRIQAKAIGSASATNFFKNYINNNSKKTRLITIYTNNPTPSPAASGTPMDAIPGLEITDRN